MLFIKAFLVVMVLGSLGTAIQGIVSLSHSGDWLAPFGFFMLAISLFTARLLTWSEQMAKQPTTQFILIESKNELLPTRLAS